MSNRYYTVMVIPEKTAKTRRIVIPDWLLKGALIGLFFTGILGVMMLLDYWYVMGQIGENKQLKIENRRLRQQVQIFRNKMETIETTMDRIETFATRLRVITNIEDREGLVRNLDRQAFPNADTNIGARPKQPAQARDEQTEPGMALKENDPENIYLKQQQEQLERKSAALGDKTLLLEENLQDLYELLWDQRAFLAALPTVKPSRGYFTSGFGLRKSPTGGLVKMHEGLDIANHPGTPVWSSANGVVRFAGRKPGYGQTVIIDHGYGLETWYTHNRAIMVRNNSKVRRHDKIALMGSTGRTTGPHVHYEVRVHGVPVDPMTYILEN